MKRGKRVSVFIYFFLFFLWVSISATAAVSIECSVDDTEATYMFNSRLPNPCERSIRLERCRFTETLDIKANLVIRPLAVTDR